MWSGRVVVALTTLLASVSGTEHKHHGSRRVKHLSHTIAQKRLGVSRSFAQAQEEEADHHITTRRSAVGASEHVRRLKKHGKRHIIKRKINSTTSQEKTKESPEHRGKQIQAVVDALEDLKKAHLTTKDDLEQAFQAENEKRKNEIELYMREIGEAQRGIEQNEFLRDQAIPKVSYLETKLKHLSADIKEEEDGLAEATTVRDENRKKFQEQNAELNESLAQIANAIKVLGAFHKGEKAMQDASVLQVQGGKTTDVKILGQIMQRPDVTGFLQEKVNLKEAGDSDVILGVLTELEDNLQRNLREALRDEEKQENRFTRLSGRKNDQLKKLSEVLTKKKHDLAQWKRKLSTAQTDLTELQELKSQAQTNGLQLKDDEKTALREQKDVLEDMNAELKAMEKAMQVLLSFRDKESRKDEGKTPAVDDEDTKSSGSSFLQLKSDSSTVGKSSGRFDGVQKAIAKRIADKKQEGARTLKKKTKCETELGTMATQLEEAEQQEEQGRANKHKVNAEMKELEESYIQLDENMQSLQQSQTELKKLQAEKVDLHTAGQAERIEALRAFNQAKAILEKELHEKGKTIYATIDYITEKIKKEQDDTAKEFKDATAAFDDNMKKLSEQAEAAYEEYSVKRSRFAETEVAFETASEDADELLKALRSVHGEKAKVDDLCLQFLAQYASTSQAREDEIEMLQRTQHILAGMEEDTANDAVLLQATALKKVSGGLSTQRGSPGEMNDILNSQQGSTDPTESKELAMGLASLESMSSQLLKQ